MSNAATARDRALTRRWQRWLPWANLTAAQHASVSVSRESLLAAYEHTHREAMLRCLSLGLPLATIIRYGLDDPQHGNSTRGTLIDEALERRTSRMGRVKGITRARATRTARQRSQA